MGGCIFFPALYIIVGMSFERVGYEPTTPAGASDFQLNQAALNCRSYTCPDGYMLLPNAEHFLGQSPAACCEEAMCHCTVWGGSSFSCSFSSLSPFAAVTVADSDCGVGYRCLWNSQKKWRYSNDRYAACIRRQKFGPTTAPVHTFYMYRTSSQKNEPTLDGINTANAVGQMIRILMEVFGWYAPGALFLRRLKVQVRPTAPLVARGMTFGPWSNYNDGLCGGPVWPYDALGQYNFSINDFCGPILQKYGAVVGCKRSQYMDNWHNSPVLMNTSFWYSFPGPCHNRRYWLRDDDCMTENPFGRCTGVPTGAEDCTFSVEPAGEIELCELCGVEDCAAFHAAGGVEYDNRTDRGVNCTFFDDTLRPESVLEKAAAMELFFKEKFGSEEVEEALCDYKFDRQDVCPESMLMDSYAMLKEQKLFMALNNC